MLIFNSVLCRFNLDVVVLWADGRVAGILTDGVSNVQKLMLKRRRASSAPCCTLHTAAAYSDILP